MLLTRLYNLFSRPYLNRLLAAEISAFSTYYDAVYQIKCRPDDLLLNSISCGFKLAIPDLGALPSFRESETDRALILLNGNFNHHDDLQELLRQLKEKMSRSSRLAAVVYNSYLRLFYKAANKLGIRRGELPTTFLTFTAIENIAALSGFDVVRTRSVGFLPFSFWGLGTAINRLLRATPFLSRFGFVEVVLLRPRIPSRSLPSLSIVIPARNEKGNIENALKRLPQLGDRAVEVIFVEGHSTDGTWAEIQRVIPLYADRFSLKAFQQKGKGKSDAVRLGFAHATGDLLTILDADLTMPPELLPRFYNAYVEGLGDFVNGNRLVYPMEGKAMRFLNLLGNVFFAKMLSAVLGSPIGDSLCGTKLLSRGDYLRFSKWRGDFGEFDPFGDFELLFPAAVLGLGIIDVPIQYRARTYGSTNIHRFVHGLLLLKMTLIGLFRIRIGTFRLRGGPEAEPSLVFSLASLLRTRTSARDPVSPHSGGS